MTDDKKPSDPQDDPLLSSLGGLLDVETSTVEPDLDVDFDLPELPVSARPAPPISLEPEPAAAPVEEPVTPSASLSPTADVLTDEDDPFSLEGLPGFFPAPTRRPTPPVEETPRRLVVSALLEKSGSLDDLDFSLPELPTANAPSLEPSPESGAEPDPAPEPAALGDELDAMFDLSTPEPAAIHEAEIEPESESGPLDLEVVPYLDTESESGTEEAPSEDAPVSVPSSDLSEPNIAPSGLDLGKISIEPDDVGFDFDFDLPGLPARIASGSDTSAAEETDAVDLERPETAPAIEGEVADQDSNDVLDAASDALAEDDDLEIGDPIEDVLEEETPDDPIASTDDSASEDDVDFDLPLLEPVHDVESEAPISDAKSDLAIAPAPEASGDEDLESDVSAPEALDNESSTTTSIEAEAGHAVDFDPPEVISPPLSVEDIDEPLTIIEPAAEETSTPEAPARSAASWLSPEEIARLESELGRSARAHRAAASAVDDETHPVAVSADDYDGLVATDGEGEEPDPFALPDVPLSVTAADDDLVAAAAGLDIAEPEEAPPVPESLADRMNEDLNVGDREIRPGDEDLTLPTFRHQRPDIPTEEEGPLVIRRQIIEQGDSVAPGAARFPLLARAKAAGRDVWDGPLGWRGHEKEPGFIAAKAFARLGLGFIVPVLAAVLLVGLPTMGSAYRTQAFDAGNSDLAWMRGLVELPAPLVFVDLPEGGRITSTTEPILTSLYARFFETYDTALADGDTARFDDLLSEGLAAQVKAEVEALRAAGHTRTLYGYAADASSLYLRSGIPPSDATDVLASVLAPTTIEVTDASGNLVSTTETGSVDVHFLRLPNGIWRISSLVFQPVTPPEAPIEGPDALPADQLEPTLAPGDILPP